MDTLFISMSNLSLRSDELSDIGPMYHLVIDWTTAYWGELRKSNKIKYFSWKKTHWGRVTHICFSKLTSIGSDNGLSPSKRQAVTWTNTGILLIGPVGTNSSDSFIRILIFSYNKMHLKLSSAKQRPFVTSSMCQLIWCNVCCVMSCCGDVPTNFYTRHVISPALGQFYDCPIASEATLKSMAK